MTIASCSQVLVVRRSLDILDILVLLECDTTVGHLGSCDLVLAVEHGAGTSPVPVEASDVLQASHLFVGQVGDDLEHVATVAIDTEDILVDEVGSPWAQLEEEGGADHTTDDPFRLHGVSHQKFFVDQYWIPLLQHIQVMA